MSTKNEGSIEMCKQALGDMQRHEDNKFERIDVDTRLKGNTLCTQVYNQGEVLSPAGFLRLTNGREAPSEKFIRRFQRAAGCSAVQDCRSGIVDALRHPAYTT
jgi:hypothetical protein